MSITTNAVDLAFKLGVGAEPDLAARLVMELLRTQPDVVLKAHNALVMGVCTDKFAAIPGGVLGQMITALRCNNKIAAVKLVREAKGYGLKEAMDVTNELANELAARDSIIG